MGLLQDMSSRNPKRLLHEAYQTRPPHPAPTLKEMVSDLRSPKFGGNLNAVQFGSHRDEGAAETSPNLSGYHPKHLGPGAYFDNFTGARLPQSEADAAELNPHIYTFAKRVDQ